MKNILVSICNDMKIVCILEFYLLLICGVSAETLQLDRTNGLSAADWQGISAAHQITRHAFVEMENGSWRARNPGQQWLMSFDGNGFTAFPQGADWKWGLELQSYGFGENQRSVALLPALAQAAGERLTYKRESLEEWFVNSTKGVEHGFTLLKRPMLLNFGLDSGFDVCSSSFDEISPLCFTINARGGLKPVATTDREGINFQNIEGVTVISYTGLKAWDADGRSLPAWLRVADLSTIQILVDERGARYPIIIDPIAQQAYIKASNPGTGNDDGAPDGFGSSVAASGDTVVVGAPFEDSRSKGVNGDQGDNSTADSGAAYVFVRIGGVWGQQAYLKASNPDPYDYFGGAVAISGDTIVVGASTESSKARGVNGDQLDNSIENSGAAYVFTRIGGVWSQQAYLKASNTEQIDVESDNRFGNSVAISGETVVVGASGEDSGATGVNGDQNDTKAQEAGAAYVFVRRSGTWAQEAYLKASNSGRGDHFGSSVSISGDTVVVAAPWEASIGTGVNGNQLDNSAEGSGAAYVFARSGGVWSQQAYLKASNTNADDRFGISVTIDGDLAAVGALREDSQAAGVNGNQADNSAEDSGAAYVFKRSLGVWTQQAYLKASNTNSDDRFGISVAIAGNVVVVGASREDSGASGIGGGQADNTSEDSGAVYVFTLSNDVWAQLAYLKASNPDSYDYFGESVAVVPNLAIIGAFREDSSASGINGSQGNNPAGVDSGAVYTFGVDSGSFPEADFTATLSREGENFLISFPSAVGKSYTLWSSETIARESWKNTGLPSILGDGSVKNFRFPAPVSGISRRFYRVQADSL